MERGVVKAGQVKTLDANGADLLIALIYKWVAVSALAKFGSNLC
jgi:hypothetical protein